MWEPRRLTKRWASKACYCGTTVLSVCPSVCVSPQISLGIWGLWYHLAVCVSRLPKFYCVLCGPCIKGHKAISYSQNCNRNDIFPSDVTEKFSMHFLSFCLHAISLFLICLLPLCLAKSIISFSLCGFLLSFCYFLSFFLVHLFPSTSPFSNTPNLCSSPM
jgi:hypothetical protein